MPVTVLVSKTSSYFGYENGIPVSGAKVSIRIESGNPIALPETEPGIYTLGKANAMTGFWYVVDVAYEGVTYSARSFLNKPVPFIDLNFTYFDGYGFFDSGYLANCYISDPADIENYYRIKYYVNKQPVSELDKISIFSDKLFNGTQIGLCNRSFVFSEDDTLTVELQSIDKAAYDYFSTLESISGPDWEQNAAPANPISNFSNGALGYFSAYSFERRTVVIKDYLQKQ